MSNRKEITEDEDFGEELRAAGSKKLVVADFNATWCGPCKAIRPVFHHLAHKYPKALFLGVDVDLCRETAMEQGVSAMPTFILYKDSHPIEVIRGANSLELEERIRDHYEEEEPRPSAAKATSTAISTNANSAGAATAGPAPGPAHAQPQVPSAPVDMTPYLDRKHCEARNQAPMTPFSQFLAGKTVIKSDLDEQLILAYTFTQEVKLHSFKIKSTVRNGPKRIKFFINQPHILDFDTAETMTSAQDITLNEKELSGKHYVDLRSLRVQPLRTLQMFIAGNQTADEVTQIDSLTFYGIPLGAAVPSASAVLPTVQPPENFRQQERKNLMDAETSRIRDRSRSRTRDLTRDRNRERSRDHSRSRGQGQGQGQSSSRGHRSWK